MTTKRELQKLYWLMQDRQKTGVVAEGDPAAKVTLTKKERRAIKKHQKELRKASRKEKQNE